MGAAEPAVSACSTVLRRLSLQHSRVHLLGGRGIEAAVAIDHTRSNQVNLKWLLYDGHGNLEIV
ncbi:MAG: hypothetical protein KatS3mg017_0384 [Fimbriimonadales bacterium]|nr:MAG: hypothetical protein KatS3mg017_0384 [Fimbriimonadales bacterium]